MAFATVAELALYLQRTFTPTQDAQGQLALDLATGLIQGHTRQRLERVVNDSVRLRDTYGGDTLTLPERPVISVASVTVDGTALVLDDGYAWDGSDVLVRLGDWWANGKVIQVVYTHGFSPIPVDVKNVCLRAAARSFTNPSGLVSETIDFWTRTYSSAGERSAAVGVVLTDDDKADLNHYRLRVHS